MMNNTMSIAIVRTLCEMGLVIEKIDESTDVPIFYISVPEFSYHKTDNGIDVANKYLTKKYKETLTMLGVKCIVKSKIREGETWTKEMANNAIIDFDKVYRYGKF